MKPSEPRRSTGTLRTAVLLSVWLSLSTVWFTPNAEAQEPDLRSLFPQRADVVLDSSSEVGGPSRLELPSEVLLQCRADLSDLRLLAEDAGGEITQVPFVIDDRRTRGDAGSLQLRRRIAPRVVDLFREQIGEDSARRHIERIVVEVPAPDPSFQSGPSSWSLVLSSMRPRFVRRVSVDAIEEDGNRRTLIEDGSVFRLAEPQYEKISLPLAAVENGRLEITLEGRDGFYLEPSIFLELERGLSSLEEAKIRLDVLEREELPGSTRLVLQRPSGLLPGELEITTSTSLFQRLVRVRDGGSLGAGTVLGSATLFRLDDSVTIERLHVDIAPARGDRIEVSIDNGDSPALADLELYAVLRQPSLVFAAPSASAVALYFGGARAHRPRYDIAGLLDSGQQGDRARVAARLFDQATSAALGEIESNPLFDRSPPLAFAMRPGASLDRRLYAHRRTVVARPSDEGLSRLDLVLEDLAAARRDLADVRLVDRESRQWAFLFGDQTTSTEQRLVSTRGFEDGWSSYQLALPQEPSIVGGLVVDTEVPFFDRRYRVEAKIEAAQTARANEGRSPLVQRELKAGRLSRSAPDRSLIELEWPAARLTELVLWIEDGDDQPLDLTIEGWFPSRAIYFAAPAGEYELLVGYPNDKMPQYELRRARDLVLALDSSPAEVGPLEPNPDYRRGARVGTEKGLQTVLLWGAVLLAVAVLTVLTLRLARSSPET